MNRTIIALGLLACSTHIAAQDVNIYTPGSDEGIVYFLPKTALEVNIIATRINYQPGELCQYANRYLRMNNVNPQPETYWEIKQIDVRSAGVPDSTKAYIIKLKDKSVLSNIELTEDGIAKAINTTFPKEYEQNKEYELEKPLPHENSRKYMTEEILMAGSTAKMAELTAKEIYNIRESKNLILRGQADTMPKDGASLKLIIDNLDKQEKALTQMFAGTTDREDKVFTVRVTPEDNVKDKIILRFSRLLGALSTDNLAGDPIYISINSTVPLPVVTDDGKKKPEQTIPQYYDKLGFSYNKFADNLEVASLEWDFNNYKPDIVVINLGTNDMNYATNDATRAEFEEGYIEFLKLVRSHNPDAYIFCTYGVMGNSLLKNIKNVCEQYSAQTGDERVRFFTLSMQDENTNGIAADWHPSEKTHEICAEKAVRSIKETLGME